MREHIVASIGLFMVTAGLIMVVVWFNAATVEVAAASIVLLAGGLGIFLARHWLSERVLHSSRQRPTTGTSV